MPICTHCAAVFCEEDKEIHKCDPKCCPKPGTEIQQSGKVVDIKTKEEIKTDI